MGNFESVFSQICLLSLLRVFRTKEKGWKAKEGNME